MDEKISKEVKRRAFELGFVNRFRQLLKLIALIVFFGGIFLVALYFFVLQREQAIANLFSEGVPAAEKAGETFGGNVPAPSLYDPVLDLLNSDEPGNSGGDGF